MREAVACEKLAQARGIRREARGDDPETDVVVEHDRPLDEAGAQDQVAERGIVGEQVAQPRRGHGQDLRRR